MPITQIFDPPLPSDSRTAFDAKAFATVSALNTWTEQANAVAEDLNEKATAVGETLAAVQAAEIGAVVAEVEGLRDTTAGHATTATTQAGLATAAATTATTAAGEAAADAVTVAAAVSVAEAARDAATVNASVYASVAAGLAAVVDGVQFQVVAADGLSIQRYRRDAGPVAVAMGPPLSTKPGIDALGIESITNEQEVAFGVVDSIGRRTWIETNRAGEPTDRSAAKIGGKLTAANTPALIGLESVNELLNPLSVAFVDSLGRRTWLEADLAGKPTSRAASLLISAMQAAGYALVPSGYKSSYSASELKIASGPNIVCWGDSMTAGAGGAGTTYPSVLQSLLTAAGSSATVTNQGVGGETSVTITARSNANPFIVDVAGGSIPASGAVALTLRQINGQSVAPLLQSGSYACTLSGIPGTFSISSGTYYFTRTASGSAVAATRPLPLLTTVGETHRNSIQLIWIGQNGPSNTRAIEDAKSMIRYSPALDKRYLVISRPTSTDADDAVWFEEFGRRFIPIRKYLIEFGLADAGLTATSQDTIDIAAGVIPTSLRSDAVHGTAAYYTILGNQVFNRLKEMGWV
jgi:hypothetical protein